MQINRSEQKKCRVSSLISGARLVSGFTLAPTMGALIFYLMLNVPLLFGYELPGMSLSVSPEFLIGGTLIAGSIFYAPTVMIGLVIMMLIRRYYSWNLSNCIIGGVLSAFAVALLFLITLMFLGQELMVAGAGFSMVMTLIIIPSVLSGISFWFIAVYKNSDSNLVSERHVNSSVQPALSGKAAIKDNSLNIFVEDNQVQLMDKRDKPQIE
jgi:hypothetical protein